MPTPTKDVFCSFCTKPQQEVQRVIAGAANVYICNECVALCHDICSAPEEAPPTQAPKASGVTFLRRGPHVRSEVQRAQLVRDVAIAVNKCSAENLSDTPDFILAELLVSHLEAYERCLAHRAKWWSNEEPQSDWKKTLLSLKAGWDADGTAPPPIEAAVSYAGHWVDWAILNHLMINDIQPDALGGVDVYFTGPASGREAWLFVPNEGKLHIELQEQGKGDFLLDVLRTADDDVSSARAAIMTFLSGAH